MASVKNLKKDINFVLGDIIEAVYIWEMTTVGKPTQESEAIVDEAIAAFDALIAKINAKNVENKKEHFRQINKQLEESAGQLVAKINAL
jgi:acyl-CoA reductase-like NAD-dependent aldehyde dehydrogenase